MMLILMPYNIILLLLAIIIGDAYGWLSSSSPSSLHFLSTTTTTTSSSSSSLQQLAATATTTTTTIDQNEVLQRIESTDRGRSVSKVKEQELENYFLSLETLCTLVEPARSPLVEGTWEVMYTTAPPPSNGQLGPFSGIAYQEVDLQTGRYANILKVPPNDWLCATLEAKWEEWDGQLIVDKKDGKGWKQQQQSSEIVVDQDQDQEEVVSNNNNNNNNNNSNSSPLQGILSGLFGTSEDSSSSSKKKKIIDYGATCWIVTFETLSINLFGIPVIKQTFKDTKRVWRTTYVDEDTRIVRAGRTGKRNDEILFYMTRS